MRGIQTNRPLSSRASARSLFWEVTVVLQFRVRCSVSFECANRVPMITSFLTRRSNLFTRHISGRSFCQDPPPQLPATGEMGALPPNENIVEKRGAAAGIDDQVNHSPG